MKRFLKFFALTVLGVSLLAGQATAIDYRLHFGNHTANCNGRFPNLIVDNNFVVGQTSKVVVVAPPGVQSIILFAGPASGFNTTIATAGYQIQGLTAYITLGSATSSFILPVTNGVAVGNLVIPNNSTLEGEQYVFQAVATDTTCPATSQFSSSSALRVKVRARGVGAPNTIATTPQTTVTHNGVTFTFNQAVQIGNYVNGELFAVVSPTATSVRLTSITPQPIGPNEFGEQYITTNYATGGTFRIRYNGGVWSSPISLYGNGADNDATQNAQISAALSSIGLTATTIFNGNNIPNNSGLVVLGNLRVAATNAPVTSLLQVDESTLTRWQYAPAGTLSYVCIKYRNAAAVNLRDADSDVFASGQPSSIGAGPNCGYPLAANKGILLRQQGYLDLVPGESLQASESYASPMVIPANQSTVKRYGILHVVSTAPEIGTFAPPAQGEIKFELSENEAQNSMFQSLIRPASAPASDINQLLASMREVIYAPYASDGYGYRQLVPCLAGTTATGCINYGGGFAALVGEVMRELNLNITLSQKTSLFRLLTGWAINWYGHNLTFSGSRSSDGGHQAGDIAAPLVGHVFNFPAMKFKHVANARMPGEFQQIQQVTQAMINNASLNYNQSHLGQFDWRMSSGYTASNFWDDGIQPYRFCCTARYWQDVLLSYRFMGIVSLLGNPGYVGYMGRYSNPAVNPLLSSFGYSSPATQPLVQAYGSAFPAQ